MITIKAKIRLYKGKEFRQTPFHSGYRPLFLFDGGEKTSGQIKLQDRTAFSPGDEDVVQVKFIHRDFLGKKFSEGASFKFYESKIALGEGTVVSILS